MRMNNPDPNGFDVHGHQLSEKSISSWLLATRLITTLDDESALAVTKELYVQNSDFGVIFLAKHLRPCINLDHADQTTKMNLIRRLINVICTLASQDSVIAKQLANQINEYLPPEQRMPVAFNALPTSDKAEQWLLGSMGAANSVRISAFTRMVDQASTRLSDWIESQGLALIFRSSAGRAEFDIHFRRIYAVEVQCLAQSFNSALENVNNCIERLDQGRMPSSLVLLEDLKSAYIALCYLRENLSEIDPTRFELPPYTVDQFSIDPSDQRHRNPKTFIEQLMVFGTRAGTWEKGRSRYMTYSEASMAAQELAKAIGKNQFKAFRVMRREHAAWSNRTFFDDPSGDLFGPDSDSDPF